MQLPLRDKLAFPVGFAPGVNPTHPAARGLTVGSGASGVSVGSNFVSVLDGKPATVGTTPPGAGIHGALGPVGKFTENINGNLFRIPVPAAVTTVGTIATIATMDAIPASQGQFLDWQNNFGLVYIPSQGGVGLYVYGPFALQQSGILLTPKDPYFIAASVKSGSIKFVVKNLRTGAVQTSVSTGTFTPTRSGGNLTIGGAGDENSLAGTIAAGMFSPAYLSTAELINWANDPWSFWYPQAAAESLEVTALATAAAPQVTVFQNKTLTGDNTTPGGDSWRILVKPGFDGLGRVRFTLQAGAGTVPGVNGIVCDHVSVGVSSGVEPNTLATPVELTFPGHAHGCVIETANGTATSDWVTLPFLATDKLVLILDQKAGVGFDAGQNGNATLGAAGDIWHITTGATYDQSAPAGMQNFGTFYVAVSSVETQAIPAVTPSTSLPAVSTVSLDYRSPRAFPAGVAPGFNPSHPGAKKIGGSWIPGQGGAYINLLNAKPTTPTAPPNFVTSVMDGITGPGFLYPKFWGPNTTPGIVATSPVGTVACIMRANGGGTEIFQTSGSHDAVKFEAGGGFVSASSANGLIASINLGFPDGHAYFIAISASLTQMVAVVKDLVTGKIYSGSTTGIGSVANGDGLWSIGSVNDGSAATSFGAIMYSAALLSMSEMLAWAEDPWSFWYPDSELLVPSVVPARSLPAVSELPLRNAMAFPVGFASGFNASHAAAKDVGISVIANGANLVNLLNGRVGNRIISGGIDSRIDGTIGPVQHASGGGNSIQFPASRSAGTGTQITFASIFIPDASTGFAFLMSGGGNNILFLNSLSPNIYLSGFNPTAITLTEGAPYFMVVTLDAASGKAFVLAKNLKTGQILTDTPTLTNTFWSYGGHNFNGDGGNNTNNSIAAAMTSYKMLSKAEVLAWAEDPWSFWYPQAAVNQLDLFAVGTPASAPFVGLPAASQLPLKRNPLDYPVGYAPGFNPTHPAARNALGTKGVSAVVMGGNLVDVRSGAPGTITAGGLLSAPIDGKIGPSIKASAPAGNGHVQFPFNTDSPYGAITLGGIFMVDPATINGNLGLISNDTGGGFFAGQIDHFSTTPPFQFRGLGSGWMGPDSVIEFGVPYFFASSQPAGSATVNTVLRNLKTGKIVAITDTTGGTFLNNSAGHLSLLNVGANMIASMSAAMFASSYTSMADLLKWSEDPWSYWFPNASTQLDLFAVGVPSAAKVVSLPGASELPIQQTGLTIPTGFAPGFDASHPVAAGMSRNNGMSAIASSGSFINLLSGEAFTVNGSPTGTLKPIIGRGVNFPPGQTYSLTLGGQSSAPIADMTAAAIVRFDAVNTGSYQGILGMGPVVNLLNLDPNGELQSFPVFSGFHPEANVPYFIAVSCSPTARARAFFVVKNLRTGAVFTSEVIQGSVPSTPSGTFYIGTTDNGSTPQGTNGDVAAVMFAPRFTRPADLLKWSEDPWSFWYPSVRAEQMSLFAPGVPSAQVTKVVTLPAVSQLPLKRTLSFPHTVSPGFDPTHVGAKGIVRFSGVSMGNSFINLLKGGKPGVADTTTAGSINPLIGPVTLNQINFSGQSTAIDPNFSVAAIVNVTGWEQSQFDILGTSSNARVGGGGVNIMFTGDGVQSRFAIRVSGGVGTTNPATTFDVNGKGPFLVIFSNKFTGSPTPGSQILIKNLTTGKVQISDVWAAFTYAVAAGDGTYVVSGGAGTADGAWATSGVAALMYSNAALSLQEMLAFSEDPWSFWYPDAANDKQSLFAPGVPSAPIATAPVAANDNDNLTAASVLAPLTTVATATVVDNAVRTTTLGDVTTSATATAIDSATSSSTLAAATSTGTGTVTSADNAAASVTLGAATATATATNTDHATSSKTLGALTTSAAATNVNHATASVTLGSIESATAKVIDALVGNVTLAPATAAAAATNIDHATSSSILGAVTTAATATVPDHSTASITLGAATATAAATAPESAQAAAPLQDLTTSGLFAGTNGFFGSIGLESAVSAATAQNIDNVQRAASLAPVSTAATATAIDDAAAAATLAPLTTTATAASTSGFSAAKTLDALTSSAIAVDPEAMAALTVLAPLTTAATATDPLNAVASKTLDALTSAGFAGAPGGMIGAVTLDAVTTQASASEVEGVHSSVTLGAVTSSATASSSSNAAVSVTLGAATSSVQADVITVTFGDVALGNVTTNANVSHTLAAVVSVMFSDVISQSHIAFNDKLTITARRTLKTRADNRRIRRLPLPDWF